MQGSRDRVTAALTSLTAEERAFVVRFAEALGTQSTERQSNEAAEHAYAEISALFSAHYRTPALSLASFSRIRSAEYRKFLRGVDRARQCVDAWWPGEKRIVRLALLRLLCELCFEALVRRYADKGRRVGWLQMTNALLEVDAMVNAAFPGRLRTGQFQQRALARVTGGLKDAGRQPDPKTRTRA